MNLQDRTAVITGASSGVGRALALGFAARGTALGLVGRRLETLREVANSAASASRVMTYRTDLTSDREIKELTTRLQGDFRQIDLLVHSAGVISLGRIETAPVEDLDRQYRTNVRAPFVLTQALLPGLKAARGQVVFINSTLGLEGKANAAQYAASKHALKAIADSLREEVNADGVRVLSVFLGRTATSMQAAVHEIEQRQYRPELLLQPEDVAEAIINTLSLPPTNEVTEIRIRPSIKSY